MKYAVVTTCGSLVDLERLVQKSINEGKGWTPHGAPFRNADERVWCQAMTAPASKDGEVRLHEPKRTK